MLAAAMLAAALTIPAGTAVTVRLDAPASSADGNTGKPFTFHAVAPVVIDGSVVIAAGAFGTGTIELEGKSGSSGHEGNLKLKFETIRAVDGSAIPLARELAWNGKQRKAASFLLGFVPVVGMGASFIRGEDIVVPADAPLTIATASAAAVTPP